MMTFIVIGICLLLLIAVIYVSAKPISMGIEARRNIKEKTDNLEDSDKNNYDLSDVDHNKSSIIDEIIKLNDLKKKGLLTEEEYTKAKEKILD
tara:strand:- start:309 stop:587 length:279 start_codon:yes stop_codon:yes gene_type:complete